MAFCLLSALLLLIYRKQLCRKGSGGSSMQQAARESTEYLSSQKGLGCAENAGRVSKTASSRLRKAIIPLFSALENLSWIFPPVLGSQDTGASPTEATRMVLGGWLTGRGWQSWQWTQIATQENPSRCKKISFHRKGGMLGIGPWATVESANLGTWRAWLDLASATCFKVAFLWRGTGLETALGPFRTTWICDSILN